jgi:hypothetical protein
MLLSVFMFPRERLIELLYGTNVIDLDFSIFNGVVVWLSLLSIPAALVIRAMDFNHRVRKV